MRKVLLGLLLAAWLSSCLDPIGRRGGGSGTGVGNPYSEQEPRDFPGTSPNFNASAADQIMATVCQKLESCHPAHATRTDCENAVPLTRTVDTELGLEAGFGTYQDIINAERAGSLQQGSSTPSCVIGIENLTCDSAAVIASYDPMNPTRFDDIYWMLEAVPSCGEVFNP